jgi:uncharacterized membrane protein YbaN (DUF454 family)
VKLLLFCIGWISFVLGIIGAFLPVIPTTPFLILSAYLFSKSSPRFHAWILELPLAGAAIHDWNANRIIRPRAKLLCALMIALSLIGIWIYAFVSLIFKIAITTLLVSVGGFVITRKSA